MDVRRIPAPPQRFSRRAEVVVRSAGCGRRIRGRARRLWLCWVYLLAGLHRFLSLSWFIPIEEAGREAPMNQRREGPLRANAEISDAVVRMLHDYTGRGPTRSRTTINDDSVMVLVGDTLTRGERRLVETGREEQVLSLRHAFQLAMRDDLVEVVERATERKVTAFMSQNHIDPDLAVEGFVLEPKAEKVPVVHLAVGE